MGLGVLHVAVRPSGRAEQQITAYPHTTAADPFQRLNSNADVPEHVTQL